MILLFNVCSIRDGDDHFCAGAKDYCSYLSVHALINFWTTVGPANIRQYCRSLLTDAVRYFQSKWDAQLLAPMECHGMCCFQNGVVKAVVIGT